MRSNIGAGSFTLRSVKCWSMWFVSVTRSCGTTSHLLRHHVLMLPACRCKRIIGQCVRYTLFGICLAITALFGAIPHIASAVRIHYNFRVEYPFPPVGIVGAADG